MAALKDEEFDVRWLAAEGLVRMEAAGLDPLLHALMTETDFHLREGAHHVIRNQVEEKLRECVAPVLSALEDVVPALEVPVAAMAAHEKLMSAGIYRQHFGPVSDDSNSCSHHEKTD